MGLVERVTVSAAPTTQYQGDKQKREPTGVKVKVKVVGSGASLARFLPVRYPGVSSPESGETTRRLATAAVTLFRPGAVGVGMSTDEAASDEASVRVWLVERTYSDDEQNVIILTYATTDGTRYFRKERVPSVVA